MNRTPLSIPEIAIIAGTRAMLGAGVGMLIANRLNRDQRKAVGWTLITVGAITTIPIAAQLIKSTRAHRQESGIHPRFAYEEARP